MSNFEVASSFRGIPQKNYFVMAAEAKAAADAAADIDDSIKRKRIRISLRTGTLNKCTNISATSIFLSDCANDTGLLPQFAVSSSQQQ